MNRNEFDRLLTTYGANLSRWPDRDAVDARAFLETSEDARSLLADAEALDAVLGTLGDDTMAANLSDRIVAATHTSVSEDETAAYQYHAPVLKLAMSAAASLIVGISVGLTDLGRADMGAESDAVSVAFGLVDDYGDDTFDGEEL